MFKQDYFTPIGGMTQRLAPSLFTYASKEDTLDDMLSPGYFNKQRTILHPRDIIKVAAKDEIAEIYVYAIEGINVVMDSKVIIAEAPQLYATEQPKPEAAKPKGRPRKKKAA